MNSSEKGGSTVILACLIIDDPLLRPQYGGLDYSRLLKEMQVHNFFTEIAFIPWNYKRSDKNTVRLFLDNPGFFAICMHGCNHTQNEFGGIDYEQLAELSATALWRMEQHRKYTGLACDPVMVFPQGRFSSVAINVLKEHGYLAAFNSNIIATDGDNPPPSEFVKPATLMYHDFPIFLRRYPQERHLFLEDITNGRPILIVEHTSAFRDGYMKIVALIDWINSLGDVKWTSLSKIAEYYLGKKSIMNAREFSPSDSSIAFNIRVASRRYLSEIRDNFFFRDNLLTKLYAKLRG